MTTYQRLRERTQNICAPLQSDDHMVQPFEFVSPPKWHLGHTTWFFETFCVQPEGLVDLFNPQYPFLFNSYYEALGPRVSQGRRGVLSRPSLNEVWDYRHAIDQHMGKVWNERPDWQKTLRLGMEHEMQHQELLLMDIQAILFEQVGRPAYGPTERSVADISANPAWREIAGGLYEIGTGEENFAFDNERPRHRVFLEDFQLRTDLVCNSEYLNFIEDRGYQRPEFWHSDGWRWVLQNQIRAPLYWIQRGGEWCEYTLSGLSELNPRRPVGHVSYFEAAAFARWMGARLPTEFEWEAALARENVADFWQWTESAYLPYPGYRPFAGAFQEYNGKFMSGQMVLRGGCLATPQAHYRPTYRNFFSPEMRWQFSSIRLAK